MILLDLNSSTREQMLEALEVFYHGEFEGADLEAVMEEFKSEDTLALLNEIFQIRMNGGTI